MMPSSHDDQESRAAPGPGPVVLFVVAFPRSGTTILGNLLGEIEGWFHAGELRYVWTAGLPEPRRRCGCGRPLPECAVWQRVAAEAFGPGARSADDGPTLGHALYPSEAARMRRAQERWLRLWGLPPLAFGWLPGALRRYAEVQGRLYRGIARATGATVIVDTSKHLADALLAHRVPGLDVRFVHMVRDGRGVVMSRVKGLGRDRRDGTVRLRRYLAVREAARWYAANRSAERLLRRTGRPALPLRYESFIENPEATARRIAELAGAGRVGLPFLEGKWVELGENHTTNGNRIRWQTGRIRLERDLTWQERLRPSDRRFLDRATGPGLRRYGYRREEP